MSLPMLVRNAAPKPAKGSALLERHARKLAVKTHERQAKQAVRVRDQHRCRWPGCPYGSVSKRLEVAHLDAKGMGGDHGTRTTPDAMILLCVFHHQGPKSLHSGDCRIERMTPQGTDGPCAFYELQESGKWSCVGVERAVGVSSPRSRL